LDSLKSLTDSEGTDQIIKKFSEFKVEIIVQKTNTSEEKLIGDLICNVIMNLLNRFLKKIKFISEDDSILDQYFPPSFKKEIKEKNFTDKSEIKIVIGLNKVDAENLIYVWSNSWNIYISRIEPPKWINNKFNPISSTYVAALTVGEIYKLLISDYVSVKIEDEYILNLINWENAFIEKPNPELPKILDLDLTLVGCGANAQSFIFLLNFFELEGKITFIDQDIIDLSNKQRYLLAFDENINASKVKFLSQFLMSQKNNLLMTYEYMFNYEIALSIIPSLYKMNEVLISVDNKRTRINVQGSLPKLIWNSWTDTSEENLRYGFGKHQFLDDYQCIACSYFPSGKSPSQFELNKTLLGLSDEELKNKMEKNESIAKKDLDYVFNNFSIPNEQKARLNELIGRPFSEIFHGDCGIYNVKINEKDEPTPAPHLPTLSAVITFLQFILNKIGYNDYKMPSIGEFNALLYPNKNSFIAKLKEKKCICSMDYYLEIFKKKWIEN